jgi:hypothetical protein
MRICCCWDFTLTKRHIAREDPEKRRRIHSDTSEQTTISDDEGNNNMKRARERERGKKRKKHKNNNPNLEILHMFNILIISR